MFESFKKKKTNAATKKTDVVIKFATGFIGIQLADFADEAVDDLFLLGYVYGATDCALQRMGIEEDHEGIGCMTAICVNLFEIDTGARVVGRMLALAKRMGDFPEFVTGMTVGGNETNEVFNAWGEKGEPPIGLGLLRYLQGSDWQEE